MKKDMHWCYDSYLVNIAKILLANMIIPISIARLLPKEEPRMNVLNIARQFPNQFEEFQRRHVDIDYKFQTCKRVQMKHGISEVQTGARHSLGIIFHDALN
jgi:hypothetical protein